MPWSNQGGGNGGPWGKGGGPWGQGPSSGGGQSPNDFEDILKRSQDRFRQAIPGGGMNRGLMTLLVLLGLAAAAFYSCTVRVNPDELGIVTRFGKFDRTLTPGLNLRLPYPVEEVYLPKVTKVNSTAIGSSKSVNKSSADDSLMLTGDENIVNIDFAVNWQISDAEKFLFNIKDGVEFLAGGDARTVRDVAESAIRDVVGKSSIQPILTQDRAKSELAVRELMQATLDSYDSGVFVTQVQFLAVDPPSQVVDAFRDVQAARADHDRLKNEAEAYAFSQVPLARGDAEKILQEAQGYKERVIAESSGQASRFTKIYEEYKKAPEVTRQRMYLETMERVFSTMDKIVIDQKGGGTGVVPYLPLNELSKSHSSSTVGGQ